MKLTILVPSSDYGSSAGARIRYGRVGRELACEGIEVRLEPIAQFDPGSADCDVLLVCKCYDARSIIAAVTMSRRRKIVGVDLFDDYFSQSADPRLQRYRNWLASFVRFCDFSVCSTEAMAKVVRAYRTDLPTHVFNDPALPHEPESIPGIVEAKIARARSEGRLTVGWFGTGDNPFFPVGLADLSSFGSSLMELTRTGLDVRLNVVTNRRALTADGLNLIRRLPVPVCVEGWSETAERDLLRDSLLAFLPVNGQKFSVAKSLNRAFTALSQGCQVLSVGYPLYSALAPLIYRDPAEFIVDLARGSLRLSHNTISIYREKLFALASADVEARRLARFLTGLGPHAQPAEAALAIVHGHSTRPEVHQMARAVNALSVASPFCTASYDFDVIFRGCTPGLEMVVSDGSTRRVVPDSVKRLKNKLFRSQGVRRDSARADKSVGHNQPFAAQFATYRSTMAEIEERLTAIFGATCVIESEVAQLPLPSGTIRS